jgi:DNA-binding beta-propeller fold protein YncE
MGHALSGSTGAPGLGFNFGDAATAGGVALDPSGQWAFETDSANGVVYTYGKFGTIWGLLTYLPVNAPPFSTFAAGAGAGPMAVDPFGRFLYVANQGANSISAYQYFGQSPELNESKGVFVSPFLDGSPFPIGAKPLALTVDPAESFLYVICNDQTLRVFAIDYFSGGHLAQVASINLGGQPAGLSAEPTGRGLFDLRRRHLDRRQRARKRDVHDRTDHLNDRACVHTDSLEIIGTGRRRFRAVPA